MENQKTIDVIKAIKETLISEIEQGITVTKAELERIDELIKEDGYDIALRYADEVKELKCKLHFMDVTKRRIKDTFSDFIYDLNHSN